MLNIHSEERSRREDFENTFDTHFLNGLFIGLDDEPPAFATQAPTIFDNRLPNLTKAGKPNRLQNGFIVIYFGLRHFFTK